jgi:hypothetical protein
MSVVTAGRPIRWRAESSWLRAISARYKADALTEATFHHLALDPRRRR